MENDVDDFTPLSAESDMKELLGLYDAPAFSRRGQDVEFGLKLLHDRCRRERNERLDMVRMRLRQWASVAQGPESALLVFRNPIEHLWLDAGVEPPVRRATVDASPRKLRVVAADLIAGVERFNRRWTKYVSELNVESLNRQIERYLRWYLIEKECTLGSARLAARFFVPYERVTPESLLKTYPLLAVPERI